MCIQEKKPVFQISEKQFILLTQLVTAFLLPCQSFTRFIKYIQVVQNVPSPDTTVPLCKNPTQSLLMGRQQTCYPSQEPTGLPLISYQRIQKNLYKGVMHKRNGQLAHSSEGHLCKVSPSSAVKETCSLCLISLPCKICFSEQLQILVTRRKVITS